METFAAPRKLVHNPSFPEQRKNTLAGLTDDMIDYPIMDIINRFNSLRYCFTLQCCYGHFTHMNQKDPHNLDPLPDTETLDTVRYHLAYICWCIENSDAGRRLLKGFQDITLIDPQNIQFCSAEWFWERQVNTYALQVMPDRFKTKDKATLTYAEALRIEKTRNAFFPSLGNLLHRL
jgi:hypothetical protein